MDAMIKDVKKIHTLLLNDNVMHNVNFNNFINSLVSYYDIKAKLLDIIAIKNQKIKLLKQELHAMK